MPRFALFCGSKTGTNPIFQSEAEALVKALVKREVGIVYGGGNIGLMGVIANTAIKIGGEIIGVIPDFMAERELAHPKLTKLELVSTMHERKARMAELADAFLALPGGYGTLDELFEIITWAQIKLHSKPIGILNVNGYFDPLITWLDRAIQEGFIASKYRHLLHSDSDIEQLIDYLLSKTKSKAIDTRFV